MRVAIPGGTGLIGRNLVSRLISAGHEPVILTRNPEKTSAAMPGVQARRWVIGVEAPEKALEGVDAVVNLAGEPIVGGRWNKERKKRIRDSRVQGTAQIVSAIKKLDGRPEVFIAGSAVGVYGSRGDDLLRENEESGNDFLAGVCRELEAEAVKAEEFGVRVVRIRTAAVLSSKAGALPKMLTPFKLGLGGRIGSGRQWFPWIHESDIASVMQFCLENKEVVGAVNAASPGSVRNSEFTKALGRALSRPAFMPIPIFALRLLFGEMAVVLSSSIRAVPAALESAGYAFQHPSLDEALQSVLRGR